MIRFQPDSWVDVVMRPFDMVSPEANIYTEIGAPDIRLAAVCILALALLLTWRRIRGNWRPAIAMLALTLVAMAPWFATTGNGRYFLAFLVLSGPLAIALIKLLPLSLSMRLASALLLVGMQVFLLFQVSPWHSWGFVSWNRSTYFDIENIPQARDVDYVTIANISYSLVAPLFPAEAGWISARTSGATPRDAASVQAFLARGRSLALLVPSLPEQTLADGRPTPQATHALAELMRPIGLNYEKADGACDLLRSATMERMLHQDPASAGLPKVPVGFWHCPLRRQDPEQLPPADLNPSIEAAFDAAEKLCPRFFRPGEAHSLKINGGYVRQYANSDTKLYIYDDDTVRYKFWRSLNSVIIGSVDQVRRGAVSVDCTRIRASNWRSGGP